METNQTQSNEQPMSQEEMLKEIYEFTKKTHRYLKWQMYITIVLVVLPLLVMAFVIPSVLKGLTAGYGTLIQ
jgi:hypothetical protein